MPPADIIGAVAARGGELVAGSYRHNPNHRLLTADGFFSLPPELEAALHDDIHKGHDRPLTKHGRL